MNVVIVTHVDLTALVMDAVEVICNFLKGIYVTQALSLRFKIGIFGIRRSRQLASCEAQLVQLVQ